MTRNLTADERAFVEELRRLTSAEPWAADLMLAPDGWYQGLELCRHREARLLAWMDLPAAGTRVDLTIGVYAHSDAAFAGAVHSQLFDWSDRQRPEPLEACGEVEVTAVAVHRWLSSLVGASGLPGS